MIYITQLKKLLNGISQKREVEQMKTKNESNIDNLYNQFTERLVGGFAPDISHDYFLIHEQSRNANSHEGLSELALGRLKSVHFDFLFRFREESELMSIVG